MVWTERRAKKYIGVYYISFEVISVIICHAQKPSLDPVFMISRNLHLHSANVD